MQKVITTTKPQFPPIQILSNVCSGIMPFASDTYTRCAITGASILRDLIIDRIMSSSVIQKLRDCGEEVPLVNLMSNEELLEYYDFCWSH